MAFRRLVSGIATRVPRDYSAGPRKSAKHFACYEGSAQSRTALLSEIYGDAFHGLDRNSKEYIELAKSGRVWRDHYRAFDLTQAREWARKNAFKLAAIDRYAKRNPFTPEAVPEALMVGLAHQSVQIEGYGLPRGASETIYRNLLPMMMAYDNPPSAQSLLQEVDLSIPTNNHIKEDVLMARNNLLAQHYALNEMSKKQFVEEQDIKTLHSIVMTGSSLTPLPTAQVWGGVVIGGYRRMPCMAKGCFHTVYPYPREIPANMAHLMAQYHAERVKPSVHPLAYAAFFYSTFLLIHPFQDGNGRISRLLFALLLVEHGYCPPKFQDFDRDEYIDALFHASSKRQSDAWYNMIRNGVEGMLSDDLDMPYQTPLLACYWRCCQQRIRKPVEHQGDAAQPGGHHERAVKHPTRRVHGARGADLQQPGNRKSLVVDQKLGLVQSGAPKVVAKRRLPAAVALHVVQQAVDVLVGAALGEVGKDERPSQGRGQHAAELPGGDGRRERRAKQVRHDGRPIRRAPAKARQAQPYRGAKQR